MAELLLFLFGSSVACCMVKSKPVKQEVSHTYDGTSPYGECSMYEHSLRSSFTSHNPTCDGYPCLKAQMKMVETL